MRLQPGQTILITGGGSGIGLATASLCAVRGLNVVIADVRRDRLDEAAASLNGSTHIIAMDVSDPADWMRARSEIEERFGPVDILINCAAIPPRIGPLLDVEIDEFDRIIAVNLKSVFYGMKTFGLPMRERGRGHIVNIASQGGLLPIPAIGDYAAAKYGVVGLSDVARLELEPAGVGVSVCIPGLVRSGMTIGQGMEPIWVGRVILDGIEQNSPYIFSHPNCREALEQRHNLIMSCIGDYAQPGYSEELWKV